MHKNCTSFGNKWGSFMIQSCNFLTENFIAWRVQKTSDFSGSFLQVFQTFDWILLQKPQFMKVLHQSFYFFCPFSVFFCQDYRPNFDPFSSHWANDSILQFFYGYYKNVPLVFLTWITFFLRKWVIFASFFSQTLQLLTHTNTVGQV